MNICCGEVLDNTDLKKCPFDNIILKLDKTTLKFLEKKGIFTVLDNDEENGDISNKKKEINDLQLKLETKEREIEDYQSKINDLDDKIENMKKILLMDEKEQQYINILGQENY